MKINLTHAIFVELQWSIAKFAIWEMSVFNVKRIIIYLYHLINAIITAHFIYLVKKDLIKILKY